MEWIVARLREDSTRSAIGQLALVVVLIALLLGVDVNALLTQAEATTGRVVALIGTVVAVWAQVQRIVTPQPAVVPVAAVAATVAAVASPTLAEDVAGKLADQLKAHLPGGPGA